MKILQLCSRFPPAPGGTETYVLELSKEMIRRGHQVTVLTSDMYCDTPIKKQKHFKRVFDGKVKRYFTFTIPGEADFPVYPGIGFKALREEADVIHAHSYGCFNSLPLPIVGRIRGVKTVFTPHFHPDYSDWGGERRLMLRRVYDRTLGRFSVNYVDDVVVITEFEKRLMRETGILRPETRVHVVGSGVDLERFSKKSNPNSFRKQFDIKDNEKLILFVGRVAQKKGLEDLIESAPFVIRQYPEARFVIVGEDMGLGEWMRTEIDQRGLSNNFLLTGFLDQNDLFVSAYHSCNLLVLPSEYEAFGLVLAEAMACGKPCIATNVGGIPDVVLDGKTGILVPPRDPNALAQAQCKILSDPEAAKKMGEIGTQTVEKRFSWSKVAEAMLKIYQGLNTSIH
jgi:glycosyltransferase involved in cell wall biosynthesis